MKNYHVCLLLTYVFSRNSYLCRGQPESDDLLLSSSSSSDATRARPVVVNLPGLGKVQGRRDGPIDFFGGLPYAAPPVGNLRWAPPEVRRGYQGAFMYCIVLRAMRTDKC